MLPRVSSASPLGAARLSEILYIPLFNHPHLLFYFPDSKKKKGQKKAPGVVADSSIKAQMITINLAPDDVRA